MKRLKTKSYFNLLIILSFIIVSLINMLYIIYYNPIHMGNDVGFHWQEIMEIMRSNQLFPRIDFQSSSLNGSALSMMYPYLFLYPFVLLFHMVHSVIYVSYIAYFINTLLMLLIAYYSSLNFSNDILTSYIFSVMYSISINLIFSMWNYYDMGITYTMIFLPLAIFGFLYLIKNNHWLMLSIGMTCVIYSSVISSAFIPILLLIFILCNYKLFNIKRFENLFKAMALTIATTALFWVPAFKLMMLNKMHTPTVPQIHGVNILIYIGKTLVPPEMLARSNGTTIPFTIYAVIGLIVGIFSFRNLQSIIKRLYIFSILIFYLGSDLFIWPLFNHIFGFMRTIQHPSRMYVIPQLLLTYILASYISKLIESHKHIKRNILLLLGCILGIQIFNQAMFFHEYSYFPSYHIVTTTKSIEDSKNYFSPDYYPKRSLRFAKGLSKQDGIVYGNNHDQHIHFNELANTNDFLFNSRIKHGSKLIMPFLYYYGVNYKYYLNDKRVEVHPTDYQLTSLNNVKLRANHNQIRVKTPISKLIICAMILTICSIPVYLIEIYKTVINIRD